MPILTAVLLLAVAADSNPLAPAQQGKVQCMDPKPAARSCAAISSYVLRPDGSYETVVLVALSHSPPVTMRTRSTGKLEGDAMCSIVQRADYEGAIFFVNGQSPAPAVTARLRAQALSMVAPLIGRKTCSRDSKVGATMVEQVSIDGIAHPEMTQNFQWVSPRDGYKVQ